ncbi:MAG: hypothetical protein AAGC92_15660 [Pseudomonadota bacterium]
MSCFCAFPTELTQRSAARMNFRVTPPRVPLQMKLALAAGMAIDAERADFRINAGLETLQLPSVALGSKLFSLAASLNIAGGAFTLDDLPKLEVQMRQTAHSFNSAIWPKLSFLTRINPMPVINLALIARLALQLKALKIDPMNPTGMAPPPAIPAHVMAFRLSPPKLAAVKLAIGLPPLFKLAEKMNIPLGDPVGPSALSNRLGLLAGLTPPKLVVAWPQALKLAMVLEALAKIKEAFGPDAMTPGGQTRIAAMLKTWMRLALPVPMPALALSEKLALLPKLEDVKAGTALASHPALAAMAGFTPPKLAIVPFLNVMVALRAAMGLKLEVPTSDCLICSGLGAAPAPA